LPRFNQVRIDYGLPAFTSFAQITLDTSMQAKLASAYASVNDVDAWVGMIAEDHGTRVFPMLGQTAITVLTDQFERLRDGDRFWYEAYLDPTTLATVQATSLSDIIRRNTTIATELQNDVFELPTATPTPSPTPTPTATPTSTPIATATPTPPQITLTAQGRLLHGQRAADLSWSGATSRLDVFRNGELIDRTRNDGFFSDHIGGSGPGTFTYQVCHKGTQTCSNEATVTF
jgi:hypothetical protein